ncbi:hypothetical protein V5799_026609 [Amblyomma americanum]|uniref:Uncharacterized protein n=1 Tax=Amblyomma americanum TaxID=6943 RepID=A0AAQ4DI32_AMBAM
MWRSSRRNLSLRVTFSICSIQANRQSQTNWLPASAAVKWAKGSLRRQQLRTGGLKKLKPNAVPTVFPFKRISTC